MDSSSGEEVLAGDARWRSAPMARVQLVTGPIFNLSTLSSCDVESSFRLVDVKARFSFRTVTFGFRLKANSSEALLVLTAVQNPTTQFHPSVSRYYLYDQPDFQSCSVDCTFEASAGKTPDATFGFGHKPETLGIIRSMESAQYYPDNDLSQARRRGYDVVMTTSLSSDVPVGYFSWAEYDIMAPVQPKTEKAIAAAFISNCGARNFRLQALEALMRTRIKIDSYGGCHRNRDGKVDKVEALKRYKFSLAFENTNEEDYVTEKFFQSLVAGSVPVVVGALNIEDFAPASGSILRIKSMEDVEPVAKRMKYLADNPAAYNHTLRWKYEGPSDSFKALVDMAAVHSSCRLCIFLATRIQEQEEKSPSFKKRPCKCTRGGSDTVYHVFVRERGRFEMESIFLRGKNLTLEALQSAVVAKFKSLKHEPVWKKERPASLKGDNELRVHKIYPLGLTQRQALYNFKFEGNSSLSTHIQHNPCAKFEVVFV
ncbi:hypothetical protein DY000_02059054 [Brassica cretica]|uniref:Fucosyltransferase n=1 Tax=Brassica cretica TaxID=69181 RepID=A0ABQ7AXD4_BRACR|nr:hypothetical protein DY000_02059054 [Brassica cretica]